jgi:hypothetical protein
MTNDQASNALINKQITSIISTLVKERDLHGDAHCANRAHTTIVETSSISEVIAAKIFRRCVNHKYLTSAINCGLNADEVRKKWSKAPFNLIENALKIAISDANALRDHNKNLTAGLQLALCFHQAAPYRKKEYHLISLAKRHFSVSNLTRSPIGNELCIEIINICLKGDKQFLNNYTKLLLSYIKSNRLVEVLSPALAPLLTNEPFDKNLLLLFNGTTFSLKLLEEAISLCDYIPKVDPWLRHIVPLLRSSSTVCQGIRIATLLCRSGEPKDSRILFDIASAASKTAGYGSRRELHTSLQVTINSIDASSNLSAFLNDECCNNLHKLPTLRQSADALAQLEGLVAGSRYQDLLERMYDSIKLSRSKDILEAFSILTRVSLSNNTVDKLIECFVKLSKVHSIGLSDTARYLEPLFINGGLTLERLLPSLTKESFDRTLLRVIIAYGAYNKEQQKACFNVAIDCGCKLSHDNLLNCTLSNDCLPNDVCMSILEWPLYFIVSEYSATILSEFSSPVASRLNAVLALFLPEYSSATIYSLSGNQDQSAVNSMTAWYMQEFPENAIQQIESIGEYRSSLVKIFLQAAPSGASWRNLTKTPKIFFERLINTYIADLEKRLASIESLLISDDARPYYRSLNDEDIRLVKKWNNDRDLSPGQASKLLSARVAEKFVKNILCAHYGASDVSDISLQQLNGNADNTHWSKYDLYVASTDRAIDCKNARKPYNSPFFSEYHIPMFKKQRIGGAGVHYACCLSEYIPATHFDVSSDSRLLESCHSLVEPYSISLIGVITERVLGDLNACISKHSLPLKIIPDIEPGSTNSYFIPEWMLGTCEWISPDTLIESVLVSLAPSYDMLSLCLEVLYSLSSDTLSARSDPGDNALPYAVKAQFYCSLIYGSAPNTGNNIISPLKTKRFGSSIGLLSDLLQAASYRRLKAALFLWCLSELILCLSHRKRFRDTIFALLDKNSIARIVHYIGDPNDYIQMAWDTFYELSRLVSASNSTLPRLTSFRLHTRGILTASTEDDRRLTLIAYCGGRLKLANQFLVSCGNNPLYALKNEWCPSCGRLICDKCNFCSRGCSRVASLSENINIEG